MFKAAQISLGEGQSFEDVKIFGSEELAATGHPVPFEGRTMGFESRGTFYLVHVWNIISIKLDKTRRGGPGFKASRVILAGDANYDDVLVLDQDNWQSQGIPYVLKTRDGITAQMVFSCPEGTFIILDQSVTFIGIDAPRPTIRSAQQVQPQEIEGQSASKTLNGRINH